MNYEIIIKEYEGKGIPYQGVCDDIRYMVSCILNNIPKKNNKINKLMKETFSMYRMIKDLEIEDNYCLIKFNDKTQDKQIEFMTFYHDKDYIDMLYTKNELVEEGYNEEQAKRLLGTYKFSGECHTATLEYLKLLKNDSICAVTSLCISINNIFYFHSYIWDKDSNMIIDLARNIVMDKNDYDFLFTYREINVLNYREYMEYISKTEKHIYNHLLYLALLTLSKENEEKKKLICV